MSPDANAPNSPMSRAFGRLGYRKNVDKLIAEARDEKKGMAKTLTAKDLIVLGVAGIIGAGIFVLIGEGIEESGIGVIPAFAVAALICAVAGYAYAELSSSIPASGSAYAYIYTALGELPGWLVAWALVLEYAVGAIAVSIGWRNNFLALLNQFHDSDPTTDVFSNDNAWFGGATKLWYGLTHSPFEHVTLDDGTVLDGLVNLPSVLIVLLVTLLLVRGTKESARFTLVLVLIKVSILLLAIVGGFLAFDAANFDDPFPHPTAEFPDIADTRGFMPALGAIIATAAIMFFAYIGFDSVSTTAEETKNPKKDMPKGILGSLIITTVLYVLAALALTSASNWTQFTGDSVEATNARGEPFGYVFEKNGFLEVGGFGLGALLIRIGALVGTTSVLLVLILGGVRVFFNMSRDGLLPPMLHRVSSRGAPAVGTLFYGGFTVLFAGLLTLGRAIDLVNIGTLFAFLMVVLATWLFRIRRPDVERPFKMPMWSVLTRDGKPYIAMLPILGILGIGLLIYKLDDFTKIASLTWTGIGLLFYAFYGIRNSKEAHERHGVGHTAPATVTLGVTKQEDRIPDRIPPAKPAKGAYTHNGYTLYAREANGRTLYFFARNTPKSGHASAMPSGYEVGVNDRTGLPFLRKA